MIAQEIQEKQDRETLAAMPEFRRFLFRVIQMAGILEASTDGSEGRHLAYYEGRRNLGFDILHDVELAQAAPHDDALTTIFLVLREAAQNHQETKREPRSRSSTRYDRDAAEQPDGDE